MKKSILFFLVIFLIVCSSLYSQFNEPIQVNSPYFQVKFSEQQALKVIENEIYVSFLKKEGIHQKVIFGYSDDYGNSFNFTEIDTTHAYFGEPVFEILSNGTIAVFYTNYHTTIYSNLYKAISNDNGNTFDIEMISENVFRAPVVTSNNDVIQLCYITGKKKQLSYYEHFTNIEEFENANINQPITRFRGTDVFHGPVHSNSDIWIEQGGGGNNNGWPTFHEKVTTAGNFLHYPSGILLVYVAPMDMIFLGGYQEELLNPYGPIATELRMYGMQPFSNPDADIVYVKINGSAYQSWYGEIELVDYEDFDVYSWYPMNAAHANAIIDAGGNWFEDSDIVWTNQIAIYDTTWIPGPNGTVNNYSIFVEDQQLWIEGYISGKQTWGCADTIFIVGDITYQGTTMGAPPDEDPVNMTDYFGLVSEKKIIIKYKNIDPFENFSISADNCNDIYLYGAFAALGQGDTLIYGANACHYDGIFTFEYQHHHGSTPNFTAMSPYSFDDTLYTYIDFHKFIYPHSPFVPPNIEGFNLHGGDPTPCPFGTCGYPYESSAYIYSYPNNNPSDYIFPYGTDWPAYNPVWPESAENIVFERGTIHLFGSLAQRRRGYVHRSGSDPYNHPNGYSNPSPWDLDNWHYDGCHFPTGYDKDYHYDSRLMNNLLTDYPHVNIGGSEQIFNVARSIDNGITFQTQFEQSFEHMITDISIDQENDLVVIAYGTSSPFLMNIIISTDNGNSYFENSLPILLADLKNIKIYENDIYLFGTSLVYEYSLEIQVDEIAKYDYINNVAELLESFEYNEIHLNNFNISDSNIKVYEHVNILDNPLNFDFIYAINSDDFEYNYTWQSDFSAINLSPFSKISITFDESDSIYVSFLRTEYDSEGWGDLFLVSGYLDYLSSINNEEVNPMIIDISSYPNPFNPSTTISFTAEDAENAEIIIYNLKGQKVKQLLSDQLPSGKHSVVWDGTDDNNKLVTSGIYFYKLNVNGKTEAVKKCLLLK
ncbi:MAG: T9SS type A sorting domain-containing protein [Armatimonadetes bacterium]|nr:T9SS type A sorting domain-containing protein [Armatimonadota bacterium]